MGAGGVFSVLSHFVVFSLAINCSGGLPHQSAGKRERGIWVFGKTGPRDTADQHREWAECWHIMLSSWIFTLDN